MVSASRILRATTYFLFCLIAGFSLASPITAQQIPWATVCAIMKSPAAFAGRIVKVRATVSGGFEFSTIVDENPPPRCQVGSPGQAPWFQSAPKKDERSQLSGDEGGLQRNGAVFLVEDEVMRRFIDALDAQTTPPPDRCAEDIGGYPKYTVTATMVGRVDYSRDGGFGHLNAWKVRFLLISVKDVLTKEISYQYLKCPTTTSTPLPNLQAPGR